MAENVKGILMGDAKEYAKKILSDFDKAGYVVQEFLLNANRMGVPQKRERVFFIAIRKDLAPKLPQNISVMFNDFPILDLVFFEPLIKFGKIKDSKYVDEDAEMTDVKRNIWNKREFGDLDFSFSGLKTGVLYFIQKQVKINPNFIKENLNDICASIQYTIVEILMDKLKNAVKQTGIKHIAIAGGVSANSEIRNRLQLAEKHFGWTTYIPKFEYTTDNAAMIAITGYLKYLNNDYSDVSVTAKARLKVTE